MNSGIYQIRNIVNNKIYIGSSHNLKGRWIQHRTLLNNDKHPNILLQRAWRKYNECNFIFEIIEYCDVNDLFKREQYYIDTLRPLSNDGGYNIGLKSCGGDNISKHPDKAKIIARIKKAVSETYANMTPKEKMEKFGNRGGENNANYGKHWSDLKKQTQSNTIKRLYDDGILTKYRQGKTLEELHGVDAAKLIREKISKFAKTRTGNKNPFYGKTHSNEFKKLQSIKRLGIKPTNCKRISIDEKEYPSLYEAHRQLNIPIPTINWRLNSKHFTNYKYLD